MERGERKKTKSSLNRSLKKWPYIFLAPFAALFLTFFAFPVGYSFFISLHDWKISSQTFIGIENYKKLLTTDPYFLKSVGNTFAIIAFTIPLLISCGLLLASALTIDRLRFKRFFQTANYLPYVTTPVAATLLFCVMFDMNVGIVNKILLRAGVIAESFNWMTASPFWQRLMLILLLLWQWTGYYMIVYLAGISSLSVDVYEAARVDGASGPTIFFRITVPLLKNVTTFLAITSMISQLQLFDQPYLMVRGIAAQVQVTLERPLMTVMTNFMDQSIQNGRLGYGAAIMFALFMIIFVLTFLFLTISKLGRRNGDDA
jgi:ABC-type sugar transport system permease subunit